MSTPSNEVKAAVAQTESAVKSEVASWYTAHLPWIAGGAGLIIGWLVGHFIK